MSDVSLTAEQAEQQYADKSDLTINFLNKLRLKRDNEYDYSKVNYINCQNKVIIICKKHGEFKQTPSTHLSGAGCPECALLSPKRYKKNLEHFINFSKKKHGDKYDYSKVNYINCQNKVIIICKKHGEFLQRASAHTNGQGCPKCLKDKNIESTKSTSQFIEEANKIHQNKYDYFKTNYINAYTDVIITCRKHGDFKQKPRNHLFLKNGCSKCGHESSTNSLIKNSIDFINNAEKIHKDLYDYSKVNYVRSKKHVIITCKKHGDFKQVPNYHLCGNGCPKCSGTHLQLSVFEFIKSHIDCYFNYREIIKPYEIDIFIESLKIGIEVNGMFFHSYNMIETVKERNYHSFKHDLCLNKGVSLIQISEYEWENKQDIIKSIILHKLNKSIKIFARNCDLVELDQKVHNEFMNKNHIQGGKQCSYIIGLEHNNQIVSIMSFNKHNKYRWEITRYATLLGHCVVGGASKLFNYFVSNKTPINVLTYADRRFSNANVYKKIGFNLIGKTKPNYCYIKRYNIFSRQKYQKHKLKNKLKLFDKNLTEAQNMFNNGFRRMWDAGHYKLVWDNKNV